MAQTVYGELIYCWPFQNDVFLFLPQEKSKSAVLKSLCGSVLSVILTTSLFAFNFLLQSFIPEMRFLLLQLGFNQANHLRTCTS